MRECARCGEGFVPPSSYPFAPLCPSCWRASRADHVELVCPRCGDRFHAPERFEGVKLLCAACRSKRDDALGRVEALEREIMRLRAELARRSASPAAFPPDLIRFLVYAAHPDRHPNRREAASAATKALLALMPKKESAR